MPQEGGHHVVDVHQLHFPVRVVDGDVKPAREVVAEGGDHGVVVGLRSLAEDPGQAVDADRRTGLFVELQHRVLGGLLAPSVRVVEFGLGRGGKDEGRGAAQFREARQHLLGQAGIAGHELALVLGPVDPGQVIDEVGFGQAGLEDRRIGIHVEQDQPHIVAALQCSDQVLADKTGRAGDQNGFHFPRHSASSFRTSSRPSSFSLIWGMPRRSVLFEL